MGMLQLAVGALMSTSHPDIDRRRCWNMRMSKERCTRCVDICPNGEKIWRRPGSPMDWASCTDCGLCVAACKTRCIAPSKDQLERDAAPVDSNNDIIWIGCEKSTRQNDVVRDCVGAFSWEMLAYLALNKKLVLDLTPCGECENEHCADSLRRNLERLIEFFGEAMFNVRIALAYEQEEHPYTRKEMSRREMMELATSSSRNTTRKMISKLPVLKGDEGIHAYDSRLLLNERMKLIRDAAKTPIRYNFYLPRIKENCYACGKCERACRAEAIKLQTGEDGITRVVLTPWRCSECGQCVDSCFVKAIEGPVLRQVTSLGPVILAKVKVKLCTECNKPMPLDYEEEVCKVCKIHKATKKRQEEAAARRKELELQQKLEKKLAAVAENAAAAKDVVPAATDAAETAAEQVTVEA